VDHCEVRAHLPAVRGDDFMARESEHSGLWPESGL
jgi:hypothetical protein